MCTGGRGILVLSGGAEIPSKGDGGAEFVLVSGLPGGRRRQGITDGV